MKRFYIFFALAFTLLASCVNTDIDYDGGRIPNQSSEGAIHVIGAIEDFDVKHVGTRSGDEISDSHISEMTMFIFKSNGDIIQGYENRNATFNNDGKLTAVNFNGCTKCPSAINIQKPNPTFLIDTADGIIASYEGESQRLIYYDNFANDLGNCQIYIVANAYHQLEGKLEDIKSLSDLNNIVLDIDNTLAMPKKEDGLYRGFPMIGTPLTAKFNLKSGGSNNESVANIPLKKLYSKVRFTMQVCASQLVSGQTPKFEIEKVEVFNVPKKVRMGRTLNSSGKPVYGATSDDDYITEIAEGSITDSNIEEYYQFTSEPFVITEFEDNIVYHNDSPDQTEDIIEFGFYMPEHKVTPNTISYPTGIPEDCKQYYKPLGVGATRTEDGLVNLAKIATYARIHGNYTDHNGQIKSVRYDIYLGQNAVDDFTVKRNQQLNNKLLITGLTNYYDAYGGTDGNISIDHRVDVEYKGFNLSMERTAILDAHFEVRPLDIELSPGSTMRITIPDAYRSWVAMESDQAARDNYNSDVYVSNSPRKAVRKYFTTNLVSELNGNGGRGNGGALTITHSGTSTTEIHRVWFYIDENPNVYDKLLGEDSNKGGITSSPSDGSYAVYGKNDTNPMYRVCPVQFKYYGTDYDNTGGGNATVSKTVNINLQQYNLWRVWSPSKNRYYDIEHEEEYLNNYASDQKYGETQNGMPFGLEGIQLSNRYPALVVKQNISGIMSGIIEVIKSWFSIDSVEELANVVLSTGKDAIYYDFYLDRDLAELSNQTGTNILTIRNFSGFVFNQEIAETLKNSTDDNAKIDGIILTEDPKSAFAYCYHKNKRNSSGGVETQKWYLPAIDEIEEIAHGAYEEFDKVFQKQKYWSCQPAYDKRNMNLTIRQQKLFGSGYNNEGSLTGPYFIDNKERARATSIHIEIDDKGNEVPQNISSAVPGVSGTQLGNATFNWTLTKYVEDQSGLTTFEKVNPEITEQDYKTKTPGNLPRTEKCRIRAVYRSGTK